jgi:hypothetical protein
MLARWMVWVLLTSEKTAEEPAKVTLRLVEERPSWTTEPRVGLRVDHMTPIEVVGSAP